MIATAAATLLDPPTARGSDGPSVRPRDIRLFIIGCFPQFVF
jgi:hypothetical protein